MRSELDYSEIGAWGWGFSAVIYLALLVTFPVFVIIVTALAGGFMLWAWLTTKAGDLGPWAFYTLYIGGAIAALVVYINVAY